MAWKSYGILAAFAANALAPSAFGGVVEGEGLIRYFQSVGSHSLSLSPAKDDAVDKGAVAFKPNVRMQPGIQLGYHGYGFSYSRQVEPSEDDIAIKGRSSIDDYRFGKVFEHVGFDVMYFRYRGYYQSVANNERITKPSSDGGTIDAYPQAPDLTLETYAGNLFWLSHPDDYSYAAVTDQSARQTESAGTWIVMATASQTRITNTGPLIPIARRADFGSRGNVEGATLASLGFAVGGAYTFTSGGPFFNITLLLGANRETLRFTGDDEPLYDRGTNAVIKASLGYNGDHYFIGFLNQSQTNTAKPKDIHLDISTDGFEFFLGYRL